MSHRTDPVRLHKSKLHPIWVKWQRERLEGQYIYHICSLIFFPSNSMVRILKSMPETYNETVSQGSGGILREKVRIRCARHGMNHVTASGHVVHNVPFVHYRVTFGPRGHVLPETHPGPRLNKSAQTRRRSGWWGTGRPTTYRWSRWMWYWTRPRRTGTARRSCPRRNRRSAAAWINNRTSLPLSWRWWFDRSRRRASPSDDYRSLTITGRLADDASWRSTNSQDQLAESLRLPSSL